MLLAILSTTLYEGGIQINGRGEGEVKEEEKSKRDKET